MVIHTATCDNCGAKFSYDAPVTPAVTPDYCSGGCMEADIHD